MSDFEGSILPRYVDGPNTVTTTMTFTTHPQVAVQFPDRDYPVVLSCPSDEVMRILRERGGQIVGIERREAAKARLEAEVAEVMKAVREPTMICVDEASTINKATWDAVTKRRNG